MRGEMNIKGKITGIKYKVFDFSQNQIGFVENLMEEAGENGFGVRIENVK